MDLSFNTPEKYRMVVLLPDQLAGNSEFAYKIHWMAAREHRDVFYLVLVEDSNEMLPISRRMTTMKAGTVGDMVRVSSKLILKSDWLKTLQDIYHPGDVLVCLEGQTIQTSLMQTIPMPVFLQQKFNAPIRLINGFNLILHAQARRVLYSIFFWFGFMVILVGFSLLEVTIDRNVQGLTHLALLFMAVGVEFWSILAWSNIPRI